MDEREKGKGELGVGVLMHGMLNETGNHKGRCCLYTVEFVSNETKEQSIGRYMFGMWHHAGLEIMIACLQ